MAEVHYKKTKPPFHGPPASLAEAVWRTSKITKGSPGFRIQYRTIARHKARRDWWANKRADSGRMSVRFSLLTEQIRGLVHGHMVFGPLGPKWVKGTHQYVARISRRQLTRRMRRLNGPLVKS